MYDHDNFSDCNMIHIFKKYVSSWIFSRAEMKKQSWQKLRSKAACAPSPNVNANANATAVGECLLIPILLPPFQQNIPLPRSLSQCDSWEKRLIALPPVIGYTHVSLSVSVCVCGTVYLCVSGNACDSYSREALTVVNVISDSKRSLTVEQSQQVTHYAKQIDWSYWTTL